MGSGKIYESLPRRRRSLTYLNAANHDPGAARRCRALIGGQRGVALHQRDMFRIHTQFFRNDLTNGGAGAGADIDLSGIDRSAAVGRNGEIGIDAIGFDCQWPCLGATKEQREGDNHAGDTTRKERRLISALLRSTQHRRNNPHMTAAAAQIARQGGANVGFFGMGIAGSAARSPT